MVTGCNPKWCLNILIFDNLYCYVDQICCQTYPNSDRESPDDQHPPLIWSCEHDRAKSEHKTCQQDGWLPTEAVVRVAAHEGEQRSGSHGDAYEDFLPNRSQTEFIYKNT